MTEAEFWQHSNGGVWRVCKKAPFICRGFFYLSDDTKVWYQHQVRIGERYFDTKEHSDAGYWSTIKLCGQCANRPYEETHP